MKKKVLIGICGGVAAYKIPLLIRLLQKHDYLVRVIMTETAKRFVTVDTLRALNAEVAEELNDLTHIDWARWADVFLIAPATANSLAKFAHGIADNLLTTLYLATKAPVVIAPAMNPQMWKHPATQANVELLRTRNTLLEPESGDHACGEKGKGRMPEPETLLNAVERAFIPQDLQGKHFVITAGGTRELIDPVRFISNYSSGKMGVALAKAAMERGAKVTLIAGAISVSVPKGIEVKFVESALDMLAAVENLCFDVFISAAAVADYRVKNPYPQKHKKKQHDILNIELVENPDIIKTIAQNNSHSIIVGFAAESENLITNARQKLITKNLDLIIANDITKDVFGNDENTVVIIGKDKEINLARANKNFIAVTIVNLIKELIAVELEKNEKG